MKNRIILISILVSILGIGTVNSTPCPSREMFREYTLYAIVDYLSSSQSSSFTINEVNDLIVFYISKTISSADCSEPGRYTGTPISVTLSKSSELVNSLTVSHLPSSPTLSDQVSINVRSTLSKSMTIGLRMYIDGIMVDSCSSGPSTVHDCTSAPQGPYSLGTHSYHGEVWNYGNTPVIRMKKSATQYFTVGSSTTTTTVQGCRYVDGSRCYSTCCPSRGTICQSTGADGYYTCNTNTGQWGGILYPSGSCSGVCDEPPYNFGVLSSPTNPTTSDTVNIYARTSTTGIKTWMVKVYIDGSLDRTCNFNGLIPGDGTICAAGNRLFTPGTHSYYAEAYTPNGNTLLATAQTKTFTVTVGTIQSCQEALNIAGQTVCRYDFDNNKLIDSSEVTNASSDWTTNGDPNDDEILAIVYINNNQCNIGSIC